MNIEGFRPQRFPLGPESDSWKHAETHEEAVRAEMLAAITRTLSDTEMQAFNAIAEPGISFEERHERMQAFNLLEAGTPDADEPLEGRVHSDVPLNIGGVEMRVSRNIRGKFFVSSAA